MRLPVLPLLALALVSPTWAVTLYDSALGTVPAQQGWLTWPPGAYTQSVGGNLYNFSTMANIGSQAGSTPLVLRPLDTAAGFQLDFVLRVVQEEHSTPQRAGFSVIAVGQDPTHGIEINFWTDRVGSYYGYNVPEGDPFTQGPSQAFDATQLTSYRLRVQNQSFTLSAGGVVLFGGALQDYSPQSPYSTPNFMYFGDDSGSARSSVQLGLVTLSAVPEPSAPLLWAVGLAAVGALARRRRA